MMLQRALVEFRSHWHWIGGAISGFCCGLGPGPAIGGATATGGFIAYEIKQDYDIGGRTGYKDILEWVVAFVIGLIPAIPLRILGVP